jgi:putative ABC transport system substrate-binding protein
MLAPLDSPVSRQLLNAFKEGLRELGYVEGQSVVFEYRSAEGRIERFPDLAANLVRLRVDLIAALSNAAAHAACRATTTIPIVSFNLGDPVGEGLVASLARPGGNVTGFTIFAPELVPKGLSLLNQTVPKASSVAALWSPGSLSERTAADMLQNAEAAARTLGVEMPLVQVRGAGDLESAFATMTASRAEALLVLPCPLSNAERQRIADLAIRHRLPSMAWTREFVEAGCLLAYGSNLVESWRRGATYADKLLRGAKPAELPIHQPTKFELVINARTAKLLGVTLPPSVLTLADEVIE